MQLTINGKTREVDVEPGMPLLWVLRDELNMTGTKYGCGVSSCGACTVMIDGVATKTCTLPVGTIKGKEITTIEGIGSEANLVSCTAGLDRAPGASMRLLPKWNDHGC